MENKYINVVEFLNALKDEEEDAGWGDWIICGYSYDKVAEIVDTISSAGSLEIVPCERCEYYKDGACLNEDMPAFGSGTVCFMPPEDFFCALGIPRQQGR